MNENYQKIIISNVIKIQEWKKATRIKKGPEERAAAELRANKRRGYDLNSSLDENNTSFLSGMGSSVSSTPSLERAIKKKKIHSESDSDDLSSAQQVVYRKGQPTATPILLYEDSRKAVYC